MKKPIVLYIIYSYDYLSKITKVHGIFTEDEIGKYSELRKKVGAECMIVPLNKFVESGVVL